jgi:hypothetical protein
MGKTVIDAAVIQTYNQRGQGICFAFFYNVYILFDAQLP